MRLPLRTSLVPLLATVILFLSSAALAVAADKQTRAEAERAQMSETINFVVDLGLGMGWQKFGIYMGVMTVLSILLLWPASKLVAGEGGTLKNSATYVLQTTLVGFVFIGIAIVALPAGWFKSAAGLGVSLIFACVSLARRAFDVSIPRAIGVVICSALLSGVAAFAGELASGPLPYTEFEAKSPEEQKQAIAKWRAEKLERERGTRSVESSTAAVPAPPTVQGLFENLQKARAELNVNDPAAVARFNEQVAAYNAAKAALAPPPAAPAVANPAPAASNKPATPAKKKTEPKKRDV